MRCRVTKKKAFDTESSAEEALVYHHSSPYYNPASAPINIYECEYCGSWHFTSKGSMHPSLLSGEKVSRLRKELEQERQASYWQRKLRR